MQLSLHGIGPLILISINRHARKAPNGELASALRMRQSAITQLEQDLIPKRLDTLSYPVRPLIGLLAMVVVPVAAALLRSVRSRAAKSDPA